MYGVHKVERDQACPAKAGTSVYPLVGAVYPCPVGRAVVRRAVIGTLQGGPCLEEKEFHVALRSPNPKVGRLILPYRRLVH